MSEHYRRSYRTDSTIYQQFHFCFKLCFYTTIFRCKTFYLQWKMKFESALMKLIDTNNASGFNIESFFAWNFWWSSFVFSRIVRFKNFTNFSFLHAKWWNIELEPRIQNSIWNNFFKNWNRVQVMPNAEYTLFYSKRRRHELKVYCIFFGMHTYA